MRAACEISSTFCKLRRDSLIGVIYCSAIIVYEMLGQAVVLAENIARSG
jgi:hypothetical protein